ncbi:MAG TPA: RHS repeat-associated core domain-containing protein [Longimicrobium sp.]|jgi:RHS repeat-associated protein|uniref:RHS repeat-associated core domain-containing protein n=1 Tax=Longimicrobium sp. TaxID=2029185 RepID=UPI002EDB857E
MPSFFITRRTRAVLLCCASFILALCARPAAAQGDYCTPPWEGSQTGYGCEVSPEITLNPSSFFTSQPYVPFTVRASDYDRGLVDATFQVRVNGQPQGSPTVELIEWPNGWIDRQLVLSGTVPLTPAAPTGTVTATVCDSHYPVTTCPEAAATYTLAIPGVEVTPKHQFTQLFSGTTRSTTFTVRNTGTAPATFAFTPACRAPGGASLPVCTASPASAPVPAGGTQAVTVTFSGTLTGEAVGVRLAAAHTQNAGVHDTGWMEVALMSGSGTPQAQGAPLATLVNLSSGPIVARDQCLTVSLGGGAAYECGDLRLAHALPPHRTRGRAWQPVLMYNSQHAQPYPVAQVDVTLGAGVLPPDSLDVVLTLENGATVTRTFPVSSWYAGSTRRVAVGYSAAQTGVYPYTLQVVNRYGATRVPGAVLKGTLTVVDRSASPFGSGWWVAGVESLHCINCHRGGDSLLWVGGDGSTRVFASTPGVPERWTAQNPAGAPDTITRHWPNATTAIYTRWLPGGGRVEIGPSGHSVRTVNRLGQETLFQWTDGRLASITVPGAGSGPAPAYVFTYDTYGGQPRLKQVSATTPTAPARTVTLAHAHADRRVTSITAPDGVPVRFSYTSSTLPRLVTYRTDRRNVSQRFLYGAGGRLSGTWLPLTAADTLKTGLDPIESKGLTGLYMAPMAYSRIDGPRTDVADVTYVWHGPWGAPRRIRDGMGGETIVTHGDPRFPALATEVLAPGGIRSRAHYDTRGRVDSLRTFNPLGDGRDALTTYAYDDRWNAPTRVSRFSVDPATGAATQLVGHAHTAYDPATGNVVSQRQGENTATATTFTWYPAGHAHAGQLASVRSPATAAGVARDSLVYDAQGNLSWTLSPTGFLTRHLRDGLGRDSVVYTPVDTAGARSLATLAQTGVRREIRYDAAGRDTLTITTGPAVAHDPRATGRIDPADSPQESLTVRTQYDAEGAVLQVERWATPDPADVGTLVTRYEYDAAGRKTLEDDGTQVQRYGYDRGGNVVWWSTGRGDTIRTSYDVLGRVVQRRVPAVSYAKVCYPSNNCEDAFPRYPNATNGALVIPEEWTYFRYDSIGRMVQAENGDAIVERAYYRNGALKTDVLRLRTYNGVDFGQHVYAVEYGYDVLGRTTWLKHPQNLAGSTAVDQYAYHPVTGALETATDRFGNAFGFQYDNAGQRTVLTGPGFSDATEYDREGRRTRRLETAAGLTLHDERFVYDARGKVLEVNNGGSQYYQWYSALGMLAATDWENVDNAGFQAEEFGTDPLGNVYWRRAGAQINRPRLPSYVTMYQPGVGRVSRVAKAEAENPQNDVFYPETTTRTYDASGNAAMGVHEVYGALSSLQMGVVRHARSKSFYSADQRLRYFQENVLTGGNTVAKQGVWEEYRYDPLGRRVLVRSNRDDLCSGGGSGACVSHVTRFVWSGDQLLWELRLDSKPGANLEAAYTTGPYHGRVSYFHAGGIDRPLVIRKEGQPTIIPHENWRGQFSRGTYTSGAVSDCGSGQTTGCTAIAWPGHRTNAWHARSGSGPDIRTWFGGLVDGMRDASGQMYMRNRYYDPGTGQFTQTDPIGLAGGLNAYGFANGDPVTYGDPYGLSADSIRFGGDQNAGKRVWNTMVINAKTTLRLSNSPEQLNAATAFLGRLWKMWNAPEMYEIDIQDHLDGTDADLLGGHEFRRSDGTYVVQVDVEPGRRYGISPETKLAHELGGANGRAHNRGHDGPSVEMENLYRTARGGCGRRPSHEYPGSLCR